MSQVIKSYLCKMGMFVFLVFVSLCVSFSNADDLVVKLPVGQVQGRERTTASGFKFYSYQGIPFAEKPIGQLRFQAPVEKKPWAGVLDATCEKNACYELNQENNPVAEDCLFINVFTPRNPTNSSVKLPVMFFIYGGGFVEGYSTEVNYGPHHLMEKDVILVTSNYRTGAFGFLSAGDTVIPGNAGLKDQNLALKWTNKYISHFGGDPTKITISGQSAGAASVGLHLLSPLSKGLFRAGISESGSALSAFAYQRQQKKISFKLAEYIDPVRGAQIKTSHELLTFLQSKPSDVVQKAAVNLTNYIWAVLYPGYQTLEKGCQFAPVIEVNHPGAFLTGKQYELLSTGNYHHVPWLAGFTASESLFYLNDEQWWKGMAKNIDNNNQLLIPDDMNCPDNYKKNVAQMIKDFYAYQTTFSANRRQLVQFASDQTFTRSILKQAQLQAEHSDVYLYYFRYLGPLGGQVSKSVPGFSDDTRHGEELSYIFARQYGGFNTTDLSRYSAMDRLVLNRFITMITDFVKTLNPTPQKAQLTEYIEWPKFTSTAHYLDVGSDLVVRSYPRWKSYAFWENIYNYGQKPFDTY